MKIQCLLTMVVCIILMTVSLPVFPQPKSIADKADTIPFQLTDYNNIAVQAVLNRQDTVLLMFHTAANFLTLTEDAVQKLQSVRFDGVTDSIKSWGGQGNAARFSKNNTLQLGAMQWDTVSLWENKNSGQHTGGKFGTDLFIGKAIEIDFDMSIIVLTSTLPAKAVKFDKLTLRMQQEDLFVEATCVVGEHHFNHPFLIHSGYSGGVLLDDQFAKDNKLGELLTITGEKKLKDSYGNVVKVKKAVLPQLLLGNQKLLNIPAGFFEGAVGAQKMSVLGGDVLKRFNIIIDAERAYIYIKPNHLNSMAYSNY